MDYDPIILDLKAQLDRFRWRPIGELHEDLGPCVLINIRDPGNMALGSNLDCDFDEAEWTHFTQITPLTWDEANRMIEESLSSKKETDDVRSQIAGWLHKGS